jgi:acyl-coenzyme A thioesterase PaaI-like protein
MHDSSDDLLSPHIIRELGFVVTDLGEDLRGWAPVVPEMFVPGTRTIRTSVLATWVDLASGLLVSEVITPRVPVTLELDVHLHRRPDDLTAVHVVARTLKVGRSVVAVAVGVGEIDGEMVGMGAASFMAAPDPVLTMPRSSTLAAGDRLERGRLTIPFAERARCERRAPGVAVLPRSGDGLNASNTVNGGLIALTVEEAVLSIAPDSTLSSLAMRYLPPVRRGPAIATATVIEGLGSVEVRDAGSDDRLAVVATTRVFPESV